MRQAAALAIGLILFLITGSAQAAGVITTSGPCPPNPGQSGIPVNGGDLCFRTDTLAFALWDGSAWRTVLTLTPTGGVTLPAVTLLPSGTFAAPALAWAATPTQGLWRSTANDWDISNGTVGQQVNLYNTISGATPDYERLEVAWLSNVLTIRTAANGTGTSRGLQVNYGNTASRAFVVPSSAQGVVELATDTSTVANASGSVRIAGAGGGQNLTSPSGTGIGLSIKLGAAPTSTSTLLLQPLLIAPTINYSAGTPGAGSYEILRIAVTETALPTGQNYMIRASGGAAGATDVFTVTNNGGTMVGSVTFTNLGTPVNGTMLYCSDCDPPTVVVNTCTHAGAQTGALAIRVNGAWNCVG